MSSNSTTSAAAWNYSARKGVLNRRRANGHQKGPCMRRAMKFSIAQFAITGFAGVLLMADLGTTAWAQAGTGTVTGRVVVCRRLPLPVGLAPDAAPEGMDQTQALDAAAP